MNEDEDGDSSPEAGDISICCYCGDLRVFGGIDDDNVVLLEMDEETLAAVQADPGVKEVQKQVQDRIQGRKKDLKRLH